MKKAAILYSDYNSTIDAIKYRLSDCLTDCMTTPDNMEQYDLVILSNYKGNYDGEAVACHHSLLPAFDSEEPVKDAVLAGVKVSGITIYFKKSKKIIAQYPVFIKNNLHYDEIKQELTYLEQTIYPVVIEKLLNGEVFEPSSLNNTGGCSGNCGGCQACTH